MFRCDVVWMCGSYQCLCADGSADGTILPTTGDEADNGESWVRAPTTFDGATLTIRHRATHESCTYVAQSGNAQHPTCSTPRTAQVPTGANVGEPIAETQHRHGPCRDGRHACPTPAICTGTKWARPTHTYSRTRTETGLSSPTSGPGLGGYTTPPHLRRDGRALTRPMRLRRDCAWRFLPRQARAARPDCGRHPLTGPLRGTAVLGRGSWALTLREYSRGTPGVLAP